MAFEFIINEVEPNPRKTEFFEIPQPAISRQDINFNIPDALGDFQEALGIGALGNPVYSVLLILGDLFESRGRTFNIPPVLLDTVLIDVERSKNIVETQVQGRNGTVKEYISDNDFRISIRGAIVNNNLNAYPLLQVALLNQALEAPTALKVVSPTLQQFGIFNIVVRKVIMPMVRGTLNVQPFEIQAVSDEPIELEIKQRQLTRQNA